MLKLTVCGNAAFFSAHKRASDGRPVQLLVELGVPGMQSLRQGWLHNPVRLANEEPFTGRNSGAKAFHPFHGGEWESKPRLGFLACILRCVIVVASGDRPLLVFDP